MSMTHRAAVTDRIKAIPRERFAAKVGRSTLGLLFIAGAVLMAWKLSVSWYVFVPVAVFGAHIVSAELTQAGVKFVGASLKDLLGAVRGKNGG